MTKSNAAHFKAIRRELAEELGFDPDKLTALEAMRVDVVFGLKSSLDKMRERLLRGDDIDTGDMRAVADTLERYLPRHVDADPTPAIYKRDPYKVLEDIVDRWIAADEAEKAERNAERVAKGLPAQPPDYESALSEIEALRAELAELRGESVAHVRQLPSPESECEKAITPSESEVIPPGEIPELNMNPRPGPDNPKLRPGSQIIDGVRIPPGSRLVNGKLEPIPPQARSGDETRAAMDRLNSDRSLEFKIMNAPARVKGEPAPSTGPRIVESGGGIIWGGSRGRSW